MAVASVASVLTAEGGSGTMRSPAPELDGRNAPCGLTLLLRASRRAQAGCRRSVFRRRRRPGRRTVRATLKAYRKSEQHQRGRRTSGQEPDGSASMQVCARTPARKADTRTSARSGSSGPRSKLVSKTCPKRPRKAVRAGLPDRKTGPDLHFLWSGWPDLNRRPLRPERGPGTSSDLRLPRTHRSGPWSPSPFVA